MTLVVDYGVGNIGSILNLLKRFGHPAMASSVAAEIARADRLILPGVGAFDNAMNALAKRGLIDVLDESVRREKKPILGLCLGMQIFAERSEEGSAKGFGWLAADVVRFKAPAGGSLKVPHMGWNTVTLKRPHPVATNKDPATRYYFAHSFHMVCRDSADVVGTTAHGVSFPSIVARDNLVGVQFHPEKSHRFGQQLLAQFCEMTA